MKHLTIILLTILFSNTTSCNTPKSIATNNEKTEPQSSQITKFLITSINNKDVTESKLHVIFNEELKTISGFAGCNTFSSKYTVKDDIISLGYPMATKMYCEKNAAIEQEFFKTLVLIKTKAIEKDSLLLKDSNNKILFSGIKTNE
ncbi:META domain-containing protein [Aquimarina sediminis]|uniref:META domain-containing protein n=1 Tax=Aquimarina sediminis TaxID=2070536 RepID=UPI000CA05BC6|nr:META domain-containing protein [Aquimarina sediminis]